MVNKPVSMKKYVSHRGHIEGLKKETPDQFRAAMPNHLENHFQGLFA